MAEILIYLSLATVGITILMMVGFGLKNASSRMAGQSKLGLLAFLMPLLILVIAYAMTQSWVSAFVFTAITMTLLGLLSLVVSGARSLFS
jgi:hypothetical protein